MFIPNYNKSALVNVSHVITIGIQDPGLEQTDYWLVATLTHGTQILFKGTKEECISQMQYIYKTC